MDKGRRNELRQLKYRNRVQNIIHGIDIYVTRSGRQIYKPKLIDVIEDRGFLCYKEQGKPCSCAVCQPPEDSYGSRKTIKQAVVREVDEEVLNMGVDYWEEEMWEVGFE